MGLTHKQRVFIEEYLQVWNAAEAARRAGYSEKTARTIGAQNLAKLDIAQEIERRITEKTMSADEVLVRMAATARGDMGDYMDDAGQIDIAEMKRRRATHLLRKVKRTTRSGTTQSGGEWQETRLEVELYSAHDAQALIGKHHGLFTEKSDVTIHGDLAIKGYTNVSPDDWDSDQDTTDRHL